MCKTYYLMLAVCCSLLPTGFSVARQADDSGSLIEFVGVAAVPGTAKDKSNLRQPLDINSTNDLLGGFSAIAYCGVDNLYYLLPDRGPKDGAVEWTCRVQQFAIVIDPNAEPAVTMELVKTIVLKDQFGHPYVGAAAALVANEVHGARLDPEGIRVGANGNLFVSDEYGPQVIEFEANGQFVKQLPLPPRYLIEHPCSISDDENPVNQTGRQANRGMEGLAISEDGKTLFGLMQSPLLQDSERIDMASKPTGLNCRMLKFDTEGGVQQEFLYHLEKEKNKLNEVLAADQDNLVVIERDGQVGAEAEFKKLMLVSTKDASNISSLERLPPRDYPTDVQPLRKTVLIDLLDPRWNLAGDNMPEKIEGLAFGPRLPDGRRTLLIGSDNDFIASSPSFVYVFAVPNSMLTYEKVAKLAKGNVSLGGQ